MKKNIYGFVIATVFVLAATGASAQLKTSYFMEGSVPRYDMNAALTPQDGYVNLPLIPLGGFGVGVDNNFMSVDNFIYPYDGGHVTFMHSSVSADRFLKRLPARPGVGVDVNWNLIGFGNYSKKHKYFWSVGLNLRVGADVTVPKDLFRFAKSLGNGAYDVSGISANADVYSEVALGFAMPMPWENLVIGGRLKFLMGIAHADIAADARLSIGDREVSAVATGTINGTVPMQNYSRIPNGPIEIGDLFDMSFDRWQDYAKLIAPVGYGAAIDVGAELKLFDERLKLSLGVNDLGFIRWNSKNSIQGDIDDLMVEYRGYNTGTEEWDYTKSDDIIVNKTGNAAYTKRLATTLNIGAEYNFFDNLLGVGVLSHTRFGLGHAESELTVTGTVRPAKWFTAAISHSLIHNKIGVFGAALNFHPRGINFFLGADYIPVRFARFDGAMYPLRLKGGNFYMGLSFTPKGRSKPW